jgi:hypothetical protein
VPDAVAWWDAVHLVDLFSQPGILAAIRLLPVDADHDGVLLHLLLCEEHPATVMGKIEAARGYLEAVGRVPAHGGVYQSTAFLPYQLIIPLHYDFDIGETDVTG